jgi:hypothetical protein
MSKKLGAKGPKGREPPAEPDLISIGPRGMYVRLLPERRRTWAERRMKQ